MSSRPTNQTASSLGVSLLFSVVVHAILLLILFFVIKNGLLEFQTTSTNTKKEVEKTKSIKKTPPILINLDRQKFLELIEPKEPAFVQAPEEEAPLPPAQATKIAEKNTLLSARSPTPFEENIDRPNIEQTNVGGIQGYKNQAESLSVELPPNSLLPSQPATSLTNGTSGNGSDLENIKGSSLAPEPTVVQVAVESPNASTSFQPNPSAGSQEDTPELINLGKGKQIALPKKSTAPLAQPPQESSPTTIVSIHNTSYYKVHQKGGTPYLGNDSENAVKSELALYKKDIIELINTRFQAYCRKHSDFIIPGYLTVKFEVTPNGRVDRLSILKRVDTNSTLGAVQEGFTIRAIRNANIEPMSDELVDLLAGEATNFKMNFHFN